MAQPFAVGSLAERAQAVRAATVGLAALLALTNWACKPKFHQALPPDVEAHFAAANSWDVYQVGFFNDSSRPMMEIAGLRIDAASRKVTVSGEQRAQLLAAIRAGVEAEAHNPPTLVLAVGPGYLVAANHGGREMAMAFQFLDPPRINFYGADPSGETFVNTDPSSSEVLSELFESESSR
jgi:hypothetical protein